MKNTYFISDIHLGFPNEMESKQRELLLLKWFEEIEADAAAIYIVGDLFDFWFEYGTAIPKGYTRILGKLASLSDKKTPLYFFTGNHDMWMFGYFENELNIPVYHQPLETSINGKSFLIGHGDGLGPGDHGYKFLKKIFRCSLFQKLFKILHPDIGIGLANYWSKRSRYANGVVETFKGEANEWLYIFCKETEAKQHHDFYIFGHRHLALDMSINETSKYINLGDWLTYNSYAVFDGNDVTLHYFKPTPA